jgi:serine/threonine protein kinase
VRGFGSTSTGRRPTGRIGSGLRRRILELHGPSIGELFAGRYRIEERIGSGGMGEVYRATDVRAGIPVAVKVLRRPAPEDPSREQFELRLGLLCQLEHRALVRTFDVGESNRVSYTVSELIDGETLRDRLERRGALPADEAVRLLVPVLDALQYLHGRGIVHRDVKPHNVMLSPAGVKLLDYGLARRLGIPDTAPVAREGTVEYMSPEQARGGRVDHRADLYACAAVLCEMLTGDAPFLRETVAGTLRARTTEPLGFSPQVRETVPAALLAVVARGLCRDPDLRFGSAAEMRTELVARRTEANDGERKLRRWLQLEQQLSRRQRFRQRTLPWLVAVALFSVGVAVWGWLARGTPSSVRATDGVVWVHNPWGRELAWVDPGGSVVATTLARRHEPVLIAVATSAAGAGGSGRLTAYRLETDGSQLKPAWQWPAEPTAADTVPVALEPTFLRRVRTAEGLWVLLGEWVEPGTGFARLVTVDEEGHLVGMLRLPRRLLEVLSVETQRASRPARVWVAGALPALPGRPLVGALALPSLRPVTFAVLEPGDAVMAVDVAGDDVLLRRGPSRSRGWLRGLADPDGDTEGRGYFSGEWLARLLGADEAGALQRLALEEALPAELRRLLAEGSAGARIEGADAGTVPRVP